MNWWKRFNKWLDDPRVGRGEFFDVRSYKGNQRAFLFWAAVTYFLWHTHAQVAWFHHIFGIPYEIDLAKQRWAQLWAWIIGGTGMFLSILFMILIPVRRHLARKSAKGQWYDTPGLTAQDLQGNEHDGETVGHRD